MKNITSEEIFKDFFNSFPRYGISLASDWKDEIKIIAVKFARLHAKNALIKASLEAHDHLLNNQLKI